MGPFQRRETEPGDLVQGCKESIDRPGWVSREGIFDLGTDRIRWRGNPGEGTGMGWDLLDK